MKDWEAWLKDLINLIVWLAAAFGLAWKALDSYDKRIKERSLGAEKIKEYDKKIEEFEKCCQSLKEENISLRTQIKDIIDNMFKFFSNR